MKTNPQDLEASAGRTLEHYDQNAEVFWRGTRDHDVSQNIEVLLELRATLKPRGVLFSSNPRGNNEEGWDRGRYGVYWNLETWRRYLSAAGFVELAHYYRPAGQA